ncbi:MAG: hypothetical protein EHM23_28865 [Acidobacteria bacterium]|nr:MAG: hypothetical protein EHM23_28865 [Acidobacteriota bacterium]
MATCEKCGATNTESSKFCYSCGAPLRMSPPSPPLPPRPDQGTRATPFDDLIGRPPQPKPQPASGSGSLLPTVLGIVALVLGAGILIFLILVNQEQKAEAGRTQARLAAIDQNLELVNRRLEQGDKKVAGLQSESQVMQEHMGLTESELKRAQALARQLQQEQARNVNLLNEQIAAKADAEKVDTLKQEADTKIAGVSNDVSQVREEVRSGQEELNKTKAELARIGVQVTEQGNMIATNSTGLDELRKRGERDYLTFSIRKKQRTNLAGIGLELRKADVGKQFVDFKLYVDDRSMDHKKIYVNRPVTFYAGRNRALYEVVVNEVKKDVMVGYVSTPKVLAAAAPTR